MESTMVLNQIGALAWPSQQNKREGWALTLSIQALNDDPDKISFRVDQRFSSMNVLDMVEWAKNQREAKVWYSDLEKRSMQAVSYHQYVLPLSPAPYLDSPDNVPFYIQILYQCLVAKKILFFGESGLGGIVKDQVIEIEQNKGCSIQDYPAAAAIAYATSAAYLWYRPEKEQPVPGHARHIIDCVEGKLDYEAWALKYLQKEEEVYGNQWEW